MSIPVGKYSRGTKHGIDHQLLVNLSRYNGLNFCCFKFQSTVSGKKAPYLNSSCSPLYFRGQTVWKRVAICYTEMALLHDGYGHET